MLSWGWERRPSKKNPVFMNEASRHASLASSPPQPHPSAVARSCKILYLELDTQRSQSVAVKYTLLQRQRRYGDVGLAGQSGLPPRERGVSATEDKFYV